MFHLGFVRLRIAALYLRVLVTEQARVNSRNQVRGPNSVGRNRHQTPNKSHGKHGSDASRRGEGSAPSKDRPSSVGDKSGKNAKDLDAARSAPKKSS